MRARLAIVLLAVSYSVGCRARSQFRPCGPGLCNNALVPQGFAGVDFRPACARHDRCYGSPACSRKTCDDQFLNDMLTACECSPNRCLCRMKAWQWYMQVRLFGGPPYRQSQRQVP